MNQVHWSRAAVLRLAVASLVLIGALFLFVFPTSALLHQRGQLHDAQQRLSVLTEENARLSDFTCTALQLAKMWRRVTGFPRCTALAPSRRLAA